MKPFASTIWADGDVHWNTHVDVVDARKLKQHWRVIWRLYRESFRRQGLILHGAVSADKWYRDLVAAVLIRWFGGSTVVLVSDATWVPYSDRLARKFPWAKSLIPRLARGLIRLLDGPRVHYCVLSTDELSTFPQMWGVARDRVHFTAFSHTLYSLADAEPEWVADGPVFSGGNSFREYELLVEAMDGLEKDLRIATSWKPERPVPRGDVGPVPHREFLRLLQACQVCVLPIKHSVRSAGQQTFLNAMVAGKPLIVTDAPGVRDYVRHGVTGIVVHPTSASLRSALTHALDPSNSEYYKRLAAAARAEVLARFTPEHYLARLVDTAHQALPGAAPACGSNMDACSQRP